jgi:hypothetical protein
LSQPMPAWIIGTSIFNKSHSGVLSFTIPPN